MRAPIYNASDVLLNENPGTLPDMSSTLLNYFQNLKFILLTKTTVNFQLKETETVLDFLGVVQPLTSQKLAMKPEGQRAWNWSMVHALPGLSLKVDDKFKYRDLFYRVMAKTDYTEYGYTYYEIVQDYTT